LVKPVTVTDTESSSVMPDWDRTTVTWDGSPWSGVTDPITSFVPVPSVTV